ncbi:MAG TPA: peptidase M28, partial [Terriglobales bacterium]
MPFLDRRGARLCALTLCFALPLSAADKKKPTNAPANTPPSYEQPQPARENIDLAMYTAIRDEGISHSHVMDYASGLMDGIGPRLTGSPNAKRANEWTRDQFTAMGCTNAHLEDWGELGMGWQQVNTWLRMTAPDTGVMIAQAAPWSPATSGPVTAPIIWL